MKIFARNCWPVREYVFWLESVIRGQLKQFHKCIAKAQSSSQGLCKAKSTLFSGFMNFSVYVRLCIYILGKYSLLGIVIDDGGFVPFAHMTGSGCGKTPPNFSPKSPLIFAVFN